MGQHLNEYDSDKCTGTRFCKQSQSTSDYEQ